MLKVLKKTYKRTQQRRKKVYKVFDRGNCFLSESEDKRRRKRLSYFILVLALLLVVVPSLFLLKHRIEVSVFPTSKQEMQQEQQSMTLSMVMYKHSIGYDEHCTKLGVPLNNYPSAFMEKFQKESDFLKGYLKGSRGEELGDIFSKIRYKFARVLQKAITTDFSRMKGVLVRTYTLETPSLTDKDVCALLEERADDILSKELFFDFSRIQKISDELMVK